MARRGPHEFSIKVTTVSTTGAFRDISQQVTEFSGFDAQAILEAVHSFGDTYEEHFPTGLNRIPPITLGGPIDDDTTTGVVAIFGGSSDLGAERVMRLNYVGGTTGATQAGANIKFDFIVQGFKRLPSRGALIKYELAVQPTGAHSIVSTT